MVKSEELLRTQGHHPYGLSLKAWGVLGVCLLVVLFGVTATLADGVLYLRTVMPDEAVTISDAEIAAMEQYLIDRLYEDGQAAPPEIVKNNQRWQVVRMRVTAYCPCRICCGKFSDGFTACNHRIQPGDVFVAADKAYRFRTEMIIPGYNANRPVQVLDRGRVIVGNRLDVFFNSHETAKKWGVRDMDVLVRID